VQTWDETNACCSFCSAATKKKKKKKTTHCIHPGLMVQDTGEKTRDEKVGTNHWPFGASRVMGSHATFRVFSPRPPFLEWKRERERERERKDRRREIREKTQEKRIDKRRE
jgi:SRSO17 transposase